jgi:hypothetical protein
MRFRIMRKDAAPAQEQRTIAGVSVTTTTTPSPQRDPAFSRRGRRLQALLEPVRRMSSYAEIAADHAQQTAARQRAQIDEQARIEEESARWRAEQAALAAGLQQQPPAREWSVRDIYKEF